MSNALTLFVALVADWLIGDPPALWKRVPHPVALFGKLIGLLENRLLDESQSPALQMRKGAICITVAIIAALIVALIVSHISGLLGFVIGSIFEAIIVFVLLAQRSLYDHVSAVAKALQQEGVAGAREALSHIVGRDPNDLDGGEISRAAVETLAENFSDGVVAPAFWYLIFGLPGLLIYKMINTADSMIAYRNARYEHFGLVTAKIDDLANWLPARLSSLLIMIAGGPKSFATAARTVFRDARLHTSPNAGWPESAMATVLGIALGGPRAYGGATVGQSRLNASGRVDLTASDIHAALQIFRKACFALMFGVFLIWLF